MKTAAVRHPIALSIVFIILALSVFSCSKKPGTIDPVLEQQYEPGRRDYTWTIDTINSPMNYIHSIWGSSPNDLWACGPGGGAPEWFQHYDGNKWSEYTKDGGFPVPGEALFGFSQKDVWAGGGGGMIWHYDGNSWKGNFIYEVKGAYDVVIRDIWGSKADDIYASGYFVENPFEYNPAKGFILHYDGHTWKEIVKVDFPSQFLTIRKEENKVYVFSYDIGKESNDITIIAFYELNGNQIKEIYSISADKIIMGGIHMISGKIYFLIGQELCRYENGNFIKLFSFPEQNFGYQFYGRNMKDIFVRMNDGLAHYNGEDIQYLFKFPSISMGIMNEPLLFEKEVFFFLRESSHGRNLVLHGKLKE